MNIHLKRIYEPASSSDGERFLVDRVWPRGFSKAELGDTVWLKDIAPSTELRKWFGHDPERWAEFKKRYQSELKTKEEPLKTLRAALKQGPITLVYAAHDELHNQALVLRDFLLKKM